MPERFECQRCNQTWPVSLFMRERKGGKKLGLRQLKRCNFCSRVRPSHSTTLELDEGVDRMENLDCEVEDLLEVLTKVFDEGETSGRSVDARVRICLGGELNELQLDRESLSSAEIGKAVLQQRYTEFVTKYVLRDLEYGSRYYWGLQYVRVSRDGLNKHVCTASLWCSSRDDRNGSRTIPTVYIRQPRKRKAIERFPCKGSAKLNIDTEKKTCVLICHHSVEHDRPSFRDKVVPAGGLKSEAD